MTDGFDNILPSRLTEVILHVNAMDPDASGGGNGHLEQKTAKEKAKEKGRNQEKRKTPDASHDDVDPSPSINPSTLLNEEASLTHSSRAIQERRIGSSSPAKNVPAKNAPEEDAPSKTNLPEVERVHIHVFA